MTTKNEANENVEETAGAKAPDAVYKVTKAATVADARAKIFQTRKVRSEVFEFFGTMVELRQPTLDDIVRVRTQEDRQAAVIETLVDQAYLPGTNERLFTPEDADSFKAMPFGADFIRVTKALEVLTEVNFQDKSSS